MEVRVGKRVADVELVSKDGNKVQLSIDGNLYDVDIVMTQNGVCSILHNGKSYNAELIKSDNNKNYKVNTHFSTVNVYINKNKAKYLSMRKNEDEGKDNKISSPMPGKVVKIHVQKGDKGKAGETVVVIEAMKMQSNYKVNSDCVIKEVLIKEGDTINGDQVLIKLDLQ